MFQIIIASLLAIFFLFASSIKLLGWQSYIFKTQLAFFEKYGLSRTHMYLVGIVELLGCICLILFLFAHNGQWLVLGAGLIFLTSIGALFFHFRFDKFSDAIPAIVTMILSFVLLYFNQGQV